MGFKSKKKDLLKSTEAKLAELLAEMNADSREDSGRPVCETEYTMARIRSYSDFLYVIRMKPIQTVCYYGGAFFFLLALSAAWCREWVLTAIFAAIFIVFATLPRTMRIRYFNRQADSLEGSYNKVVNSEFTDDEIILSVSDAVPHEQELDENGDAVSRRTQLTDDKDITRTTLPYKQIVSAMECVHSFYIFPVDENGRKLDTIICDKTQFLCGTPMQLRDLLARKCGKRFKIRVKAAYKV